MATRSSATAMAVLTSTASAPISSACAAWLGTPIGGDHRDRRPARYLSMALVSSPDWSRSAPSGATAAPPLPQPVVTQHRIGAAVGQHTNPSRTSSRPLSGFQWSGSVRRASGGSQLQPVGTGASMNGRQTPPLPPSWRPSIRQQVNPAASSGARMASLRWRKSTRFIARVTSCPRRESPRPSPPGRRICRYR